jgi:hypothetical protein
MSREALMQRVAALEKSLGMSKAASDGGARSLVAEIESLEERLNGCLTGDDVAPDAVVAEPTLEELETTLGMDDDEDDEDDGVVASLKDPSGIEEEITQDKFSEVESERHGEELASAGSMLEVGREVGRKTVASDSVARLMKASERLDKVAAYLEKHGRNNLAFKVDKIADAIDAKINTIKGRK